MSIDRIYQEDDFFNALSYLFFAFVVVNDEDCEQYDKIEQTDSWKPSDEDPNDEERNNGGVQPCRFSFAFTHDMNTEPYHKNKENDLNNKKNQ